MLYGIANADYSFCRFKHHTLNLAEDGQLFVK